MLNGQVFSNQLFESHIFALFVNTFLGGVNGIAENYKNGMAVTYSGSNVSVDTGAVVIQGRYLEEDTGTIINAGTDALYCKLVIEIDLDKINTQNDFKQGYYSIITDSSNYPSLTQTDIVDNVSGVYQFELAQFRTTSGGIIDFVDKRSFVDIEGLYQALETRYATEITELQASRSWTEIARYSTADSDTTLTIPNFEDYHEVLLTLGQSGGAVTRVLGSITIPMERLIADAGSTSSNGRYQVAYTPADSTYIILSGMNYLGNNQIQLFNNARAGIIVYAR